MFCSTYAFMFLTLALFASHSNASPTSLGISTLARREEYGEAYTFSSVTKTWMHLDVHMQKADRAIKQNYVTGQMATDELKSVSDSFYMAMYQLQACGSECMGGNFDEFLGTFTNCFSTFEGLIRSVQAVFPDYWNKLFANSFLRLSDSFAQFFATCFANGTSFKGIVTQQLFQFFLYTGMEQTVKTLRAWGLP